MKQKQLILLYFLLLCAFFTSGQIPNGYYDTAAGKTGVPLRLALHNIIKNHTVVSYASLLTYYISTDKKPNGTVWDMYSDDPGSTPPYVYTFSQNCGNYSEEGDCWNREHSWPKSWFNDVSPMNSDLFHIVPTDGYVNGKRSNYPYGEVGTASWISMNGSKLGNSSYPGYSGIVFEPVDEYKGDFARIYFYMCTRYYTEDSGWGSNDMVTKAELKPWALAMLMEWSKNDTVSQKEINRNNAVYLIQHNRNPFVDHPQYVNAIWGTQPSGTGPEIKPIFSVYPNPASTNLKISFPSDIKDPFIITISDMFGRQLSKWTIQNTELPESNLHVDISGWLAGTYFISFSGNGFNYSKKVVVIRN